MVPLPPPEPPPHSQASVAAGGAVTFEAEHVVSCDTDTPDLVRAYATDDHLTLIGIAPGQTTIHLRLEAGDEFHLDVDITDVSIPPAIADATSAIADRDQLERAFSRLEPEERAVIVLHHYLDLPLSEVAATLRIPLGTTKSRLYRGLREMRAALDADARPGPDIREGRPA